MAQLKTFEYDLIIVGGGATGYVLANRLLEDPNVLVLVLEAGKDRSNDDRVYTPSLAGSQYVWELSPSISNRRMKHPRRRIIGSSSAINSLAIIYPLAADINTLAPYFLKFQTIKPLNDEVKKQVNIIHITKLHKIWLDTFRSLDLENVSDLLTRHAIGGHTLTCYITRDRCERSHIGVAYLDPVLKRKNLTIIRNAMVHRLEISKDSLGLIHGILYRVTAKREVILAIGTFNTPQILELSSIGDPIILEQYGINVIYANPAVSFEVNNDALVPRLMPINKARRMYEGNRSRPLTQNSAFMFSYTPLTPFLDPEGHNKLKSMLDRHLEDNGSCSLFLRKRNGFIRKAIESADEATAVSFLSRRT
ncbi:alcohol oxidase [Aureobasidium pullulans]|nr:alcohol oxidase [Aureobasidium pullulans]